MCKHGSLEKYISTVEERLLIFSRAQMLFMLLGLEFAKDDHPEFLPGKIFVMPTIQSFACEGAFRQTFIPLLHACSFATTALLIITGWYSNKTFFSQ